MPKRKLTGSYLDEKVVLSMIAVAVVSFFVMAYKFKTHKTCGDFTINSYALHYYAGEVVRFETTNKKFSRWRWNFGDDQSNETTVGSVAHAYDVSGEYTVTVTVDGGCTEYRTVLISPAPVVKDPLLTPKILCPQSAEVGKPVVFSDSTNGASQWEWRFGETATIDATSRSASYVYTSPGLKTVSLIVNNDPRQTAICKIVVNTPAPDPLPRQAPKPSGGGGVIIVPAKPSTSPLNEQLPTTSQPAAPPPIVRAPDISREQFETELKAVANGYKNAESFARYLCDNLNIQVSLNGSEVTFTELCNKIASLKSSKKIKRLNVQLVKNERSNCIVALVVNLKKRENLLEKVF